jgi:hypothetical protein
MTDEHGQYSAFGPDINGQIVKLRSADGVHFTEAGARSVAHFVEGEIKKYYDASRQQAPVADAPGAPQKPEAAGATPPQQPAAAAPADGPPIVFRSPVGGPSAAPSLPERPAVARQQPTAPSGDRARQANPGRQSGDGRRHARAGAARHVFIEGGDQNPRSNRADDYSWRPAANAPSAALTICALAHGTLVVLHFCTTEKLWSRVISAVNSTPAAF